MADTWTMPAGGIAICDPKDVARFLTRNYLVIESKANRDELVEFCHLVVLLDLKNKTISPELNNLVTNVMNNPQGGQVQKAVTELKRYARSLEHDPREGSTDVAKAWRKTKELRDGKVAYDLDHKPTSQGSSPNGEFKGNIPIQVKVWSQTQGKLDTPYSEIRCAVPDLAMIGNVHNIIRYAATGFNFPYVRGQRQLKSKKLDITTQAMLYVGSPAPVWNMIEKSTKLATVKDTHCLQLVNTKLKTAAVAVVVRARQALSEPFVFEKPLNLVETFKAIMGRREIVESIAQAQNTFIRTRFLSITSEGMDPPIVMPQPFSNRSLEANPTAVPSGIPAPPSTISPSSLTAKGRLPNSPAVFSRPQPPSALLHPTEVVDAPSVMPQPSSNRSLGTNPTAVPSGIPSPPSTISSSSLAAKARLPSPPAVVSGPQLPSALPHPTEVVDAPSSEPIENSGNDTPSPSPTESHYSDAREEIKPPATHQVHRDPPGRLPGRPPQFTPTNPLPSAQTSGASSPAVVESSVTPIPTISNPDNPSVANSSKPEPKPPTSFVRRVLRRIGW
ncbi:hypothetical protein FRC04_000710 [Tulasnella sp. 424]|nr:hypothetical protein FRC04_000710 [Tulasnella sp. 424]KAG8961197.1 hypothetical protein FRC05_006274 [Tulasnella sp. 425]